MGSIFLNINLELLLRLILLYFLLESIKLGKNYGANLVQFWCSLVQMMGENGAISRIFENILNMLENSKMAL